MTIRISGAEAPHTPIWFTTCDSHYRQENITRTMGLNGDAQILFVISGKGVLHHDGVEYPLCQGSAFYLDAYVPHSYENHGELVTAWITWRGDGQEMIRSYIGQKSFLFAKNIDVRYYVSFIEAISREYFSSRREGVLSAMLYSLLMHFFDGLGDCEPTEMDRVLFYMEEHFSRKITMEELTDVAHCSRSTFCKRFKETYGCTAFEKLVEIRLRNADQLLRSTSGDKIFLIAQKCGFEDISYFCRAYKSRFGMTPSAVRVDEK